jgi:hypothetical protein
MAIEKRSKRRRAWILLVCIFKKGNFDELVRKKKRMRTNLFTEDIP